MDRLADAVGVTNRNVGLYRASLFAVTLGLFLAAYAAMDGASDEGRVDLRLLAGASFAGVLLVGAVERSWRALRVAFKSAKAALDRRGAFGLALFVGFVGLFFLAVAGPGGTLAFPFMAFLLGGYGAMVAGALNGVRQAIEAEQVAELTAFE